MGVLQQDVLLVGAMGPPGGGRSFISQRLQSKFNLVNMTFPQESQIKRIFGTLITQKLATFSEDVKPLGRWLKPLVRWSDAGEGVIV